VPAEVRLVDRLTRGRREDEVVGSGPERHVRSQNRLKAVVNDPVLPAASGLRVAVAAEDAAPPNLDPALAKVDIAPRSAIACDGRPLRSWLSMPSKQSRNARYPLPIRRTGRTLRQGAASTLTTFQPRQ
jgi:hypothetical protein